MFERDEDESLLLTCRYPFSVSFRIRDGFYATHIVTVVTDPPFLQLFLNRDAFRMCRNNRTRMTILGGVILVA